MSTYVEYAIYAYAYCLKELNGVQKWLKPFHTWQPMQRNGNYCKMHRKFFFCLFS